MACLRGKQNSTNLAGVMVRLPMSKSKKQNVKPSYSGQDTYQLVAANSQLQHVNANDRVLIRDKAKNLNFRKGDALIQQGKQPDTVSLSRRLLAQISQILESGLRAT